MQQATRWAWLITALFTFGNAYSDWNSLLQFTYAGTAMQFFAWGSSMAMFGAVYVHRDCSVAVDWACSGTHKWIFRLTAASAW